MNRYEVFIKVVECGSFTKAAEVLDYTQSAVSQMVHTLEEELSTVLLLRSKNGITLTADREAYYPYICSINNAHRELEEKYREMQGLGGGKIRIGSFTSVSRNWLPGLMKAFKEKYPDAQIAALTQWWVAAGNLLPKDTFEVWDGLGHAGEGETSIAYYLFPDWCEPEYATCVVPNLPSEVEIKWDFSELTDTAQTGDATKGTAEKGKKMNDVIVEHVVKTLKELDATDWKYKPVK